MKKIFPLLLLCLLIFSCNEDNTAKRTTSTEKSEEKDCNFSLVTESVEFEWTAFKTSEKIAVKGTFEEIIINNENESDNIPVLLANTDFEITLNSINSGNDERDEKLREFVFGNMTNSEIFEGVIEECDGDNSKGVLIVNLSMNDESKQVKMDYLVEQGENESYSINLKGSLDLLDWNAKKSIDAINTACINLHKGSDGVSKTWSEMEINVNFPLEVTCE